MDLSAEGFISSTPSGKNILNQLADSLVKVSQKKTLFPKPALKSPLATSLDLL